MTDTVQALVAPTLNAPTGGINVAVSHHWSDANQCEVFINVGLFFDGTNNNRDRDKPKLGHSNVARLFDAYLDNNPGGYFRFYVPGVGTPFPEIGEKGESGLGQGFGIGCEARVIYGLLSVFNAIHRYVFNNQLYFDQTDVRALCRSAKRSERSSAELAALERLSMRHGLLMPDTFGDGEREPFLKAHSKRLEEKLKQRRLPVLKECFIDVFGFSRGAAEARVFCQWLERILTDHKLAGIPLRFRFVGLMDTVASAGFWSSAWASVSSTPGGHTGWAAPEYLRLPSSIENCVHMVAMHELRKNFPLDEIGLNGILPAHAQQFAYPGAHSDVGGGYFPGELGVSVGGDAHESDALKLAQIPLNHMLECAIAAGGALDKQRAKSGIDGDPFAISPRTAKVYSDFLTASTMAARPMHDWLQPYLNWRWQNRLRYPFLKHVSRASAADRVLLLKFNQTLIDDAALIQRVSQSGRFSRAVSSAFRLPGQRSDDEAMAALDKEAAAVLALAQKSSPVPTALHALFDGFVHDSLAGFNKPKLEEKGYWRYRKGFLGTASGLIVQNEHADGASETA